MITNKIIWFSPEEKMPENDSVIILCQIEGNDIIRQSIDDTAISDGKGGQMFVDADFDEITWKPTHWAYFPAPFEED